MLRLLEAKQYGPAQHNIIMLLKQPPNPLPRIWKNQWIEPQDVINAASLYWVSKKYNTSPLPYFPSPPEFTLIPPYPNLKNVLVATDGTLIEQNGQQFMAASIAWPDGTKIGWPVHGPISSTEAEIQAIKMAELFHPQTQSLNIFADSMGAINAIINAHQASSINPQIESH